jgi:long-chain acyl-CoA synthetase
MNIAEILHRSSSAYRDRPAITIGNSSTSFYDLYQRVAAIAYYLRHQIGLSSNDRVVIAMDNRAEYIETLFAVWQAGLVAVPVNAKLHLSEFEYILKDSQAAVCFTNNKLYQQFIDHRQSLPDALTIVNVETQQYQDLFHGEQLALEPKEEDDLAWLFYTSGTTGRPKGAMQSHKNLYGIIRGFLGQVKAVDCKDTIYHGAPMSHGSGYYILPFIAKGGMQLIPESGGFNAPELIGLLQHHRNVSFFAAPTMVKMLIESPAVNDQSFKHLDTIIYGGGPMYQTILEQAHQLMGNKLIQIYGQGECPMNITVLDRYQHQTLVANNQQQRLSSVGLPYMGMQIKVLDKRGDKLESGKSGEINVRGETVMLGYWGKPEATDQCLKNGWLSTGDIGYIDEQGYLYLTDRSKDVIISGGSNIYPREVEEILLAHPKVSEASVIGVADEQWGESVIAYVAATENAQLTALELEQFCLKHMARFKRPKHYYFIDELPKNSTGKILKTQLRELYDSTQAGDQSS